MACGSESRRPRTTVFAPRGSLAAMLAETGLIVRSEMAAVHIPESLQVGPASGSHALRSATACIGATASQCSRARFSPTPVTSFGRAPFSAGSKGSLCASMRALGEMKYYCRGSSQMNAPNGPYATETVSVVGEGLGLRSRKQVLETTASATARDSPSTP